MATKVENQKNILGIIVASTVLIGALATGLFFVWEANSTAVHAEKTADRAVVMVESVEETAEANTKSITALKNVDRARDVEMQNVYAEFDYMQSAIGAIATAVGATIPMKKPIRRPVP